MKLSIERAAMLKALTHVQSAVNAKDAASIFGHILVEAQEGRVWLTATDSNMTIIDSVSADIEVPGEISVPGKMLYDIVRKLPDGKPIIMDAADGKIIVKSGRSRFKLSTLPREDFLPQADISFPNEFTIPTRDMINIIDSVNFAVSGEDARYYLRGIYLHTTVVDGRDVLRAAATDGARLARYTVAIPEGAVGMPGVIIPGNAVTELRKLITDGADTIKVSLSENLIQFVVGDTTLTSKLISGTFPSYERVIPQGNDKVALVNCQDFNKALDRVALIHSERTRVVKLVIEEGLLTISATDFSNGDSHEEVEIEYKGPRLEVGFNSKFLIDITDRVDGLVKMAIGDPQAPMVVLDTADADALYIIMPMRV